MTTTTPPDDFATHAKHSLAKVSIPGDTEPCIDLLTEPPVDGVTEALTCDWEYISIHYGKNDKQEMAALMPTQSGLTEALRKWTNTMCPAAEFRCSQISADLRNVNPRRDVTKNPMVTKRTMGATDPSEGSPFTCTMESALTPVYLMEITVQSRIGTQEDIRQFPSGSFKSLPQRMVIDGETWIGSQPTRQGLIDCLTGTIGGTQGPDDEDLSLMIQKIREWEPMLKEGAYGQLTDSVTLGQNVKVSRKANSSLPQNPTMTVFCRVLKPIESQQGSSPIFI